MARLEAPAPLQDNKGYPVRPNAWAFGGTGSVAGLLLVALAARSPSVAHAQAQVHGGQIIKGCTDPGGGKSPRPFVCVGGTRDSQPCATNTDCPPQPGPTCGELVTCVITVRNADTFGDALRIDRIEDTIQLASGPLDHRLPLLCIGGTRNGQLCATNADCPTQPGPTCSPSDGGIFDLPSDLRGACVGGSGAGLDCGCPGGTCGTETTRLCTVGSRSGLQCDCPGGTCATILPRVGQQVVVIDTYTADAGIMGVLVDDVIADGADLGLGNPTDLCQDSQPRPACFQLGEGEVLTVATTTTTTIPPCVASAPACNGTCPTGQSCVATPSGSACELPCATTSPPTCNGTCPTGESCVAPPSGCVCELPCASTSPPTCNGTCPTGESCVATPSGCVCELPCASTSPPMCNGTCPTGEVCAATPTGCVCQPPPCANTSPPMCNGTCPTGESCVATPAGCVCQPPCADSAPVCNGTCPTGQVCASTPTGCVCQISACDSPPGATCSIDIDNQKPFCSGSSCNLASAVAAVAKTNTSASASTRTITIHGRCTGDPVLIDGLFNLVITGVPPSDLTHNNCSGDKGPPPGTLTSTVARKDPPFVTPSGSNGEVIKVRNSTRLTIKYLNIRDVGFPFMATTQAKIADDGLDYKRSTGGRVFCNCITNNEEGLDVDGGTCNVVEQNLVFANENGIRASAGAKWIEYKNNTSMNNDLPQTETSSDPTGRHNGLIASVSTMSNNFEGNVAIIDPTTDPNGACHSDEGLKFYSANGSCATGNSITNFGGLTNPNPSSDDTGGCEIFNSSNNKVFGNTFSGNKDKTCTLDRNSCRVVSGTGNCGDNIPGAPACAVTTCPPLFKVESSSAPCAVVPIP